MRRYFDPDADYREDYDGPPVEQRAQRRFSKRFATPGVSNETGDPAIDDSAIEDGEIGGAVEADLTPTEIDKGHVVLRELLVRNFEVMWQKGQVQWLKYPKKPNMKR
jgi:hypothetical protein